MENNVKYYSHRQMARITIEAASPLAIGTGYKHILTDAPVARDVNGLPYIPATSIAGVLRHALGIKEDSDTVFGFHDRQGGKGSEIVFTDAVMVGADGKAVDGIADIDWTSDYYRCYRDMTIRQHVRIDDKGTAEHHGKFDNEVVCKGTRFVFEIELYSHQETDEMFCSVLSKLYDETLRIGGGTRCGYGQMTVVDCSVATLDLTRADDMRRYLSKSASLSADWDGYQPFVPSARQTTATGWTRYELHLSPADFFMFGSGMGDEEADNVPMTETVVIWASGRPTIKARQIVVPATSVKGALAHRTAYHYNRNQGLFVKNADSETPGIDTDAATGGNNLAVAAIFGRLNDDDGSTQPGNIMLTDIVEGDATDNLKLFFHNRIDSFTGGTIDGALFQEKSVWGRGHDYLLTILVKDEALADDACREAFEQSLHDLCEGMLPLGGLTNRGNGIFIGVLTKNEELCKR